ncbi:MAG: DNA-processing protein DprA [Corynebacterium sp.]|uniref:DNA-processing protein DprA n=1 Tax=Corynebacterium sp. TaxID=1720 RepID=UPI0026DC31EC|nr:DNA-processing protein DprA [Corynebacterium sp.]MDO5029290.1 DNA-processing protein DprA [Corynebacterium sp.]
MDELHAWAYLNRVVEATHPEIVPLVEEFGPVEVAERIKARAGLTPSALSTTGARADIDRSAQDLEEAWELGWRLIHPGSPEWPTEQFTCFTTLDVRDRADAPPLALWVKGQDLREAAAEAVALVGTRMASSYGLQVASQFAQQCAEHRIGVISGGALGVDAAAHRSALAAGGTTVVVSAGGVGVNYPASHAELFDDIAQSGTLITEYPPGVRPARHRFLTRNRLVAALAQATVVIEAGWRSGARNTATWATRLKKPLGAVPGPVTLQTTTGCHDLIRRGEAVLVCNADNVRSLYQTVGSVDEDGQLELQWAHSPVQKLSRNELAVYDALNPVEPVAVREIAAQAGLSVALTTHLLLELQQQGLTCRVSDGWMRS